MSYHAVLFDLDGTLLDTAELIISSFQHTFRHYLGKEEAREEIIRTLGEPLPRTFKRYTDSDSVVQEMVDYYRAHNLLQHDNLARPFPGARLCLEGLRDAGVALGVVTSKLRGTAMRGIALDGWEPLFDVIICLEDSPEHKPKPGPIFAALERLQIEPSRDVLMVGDTFMDIQAGQAAGVSTAGVLWSAQPELLRECKPDLLVPDFATLLAACL